MLSNGALQRTRQEPHAVERGTLERSMLSGYG